MLYKSKEFFSEYVDRDFDTQGNGRLVWRVAWNTLAFYEGIAVVTVGAVAVGLTIYSSVNLWDGNSYQSEESQKLKYQIILQKVIEKFG